jgi:3-phytase
MTRSVLFLLILFFSKVSASEIIIYPKDETEPVFTSGDAADDPAFWYNQKDPSKSVIFGTDKKSGLHSFSLNGKRMQFISSGKINNIDSRSGYSFGAKNFSILAGSNASNNSIIIYLINEDGIIEKLNKNEFKTDLEGVYGLCMYKSSKSKATYIFVSDAIKLTINQYRVLNFFPIKTQLVREIRTDSTSEGCVVDDESGILYFAQEDENSGVYFIDAEPNDYEIKIIDSIKENGGQISGDAEGLAILNHPEGKLLIASSQGSSDFTVYNLSNKNKFIGRFSIGKDNQIDGVSRTDGIEIYTGHINEDYESGILIAQDDMNMATFNLDGVSLQAKKINQNFKLVPIKQIVENFLD